MRKYEVYSYHSNEKSVWLEKIGTMPAEEKTTVIFVDLMNASFGTSLRFFREQFEINAKELAEKADINKSTISAFENDHFQNGAPTNRSILKITNAFGWSERDPRARFLLQKAAELRLKNR